MFFFSLLPVLGVDFSSVTGVLCSFSTAGGGNRDLLLTCSCIQQTKYKTHDPKELPEERDNARNNMHAGKEDYVRSG